MKRLFCVSLCWAGWLGPAIDVASACPAVAVQSIPAQSIVSGAVVAMPAMVNVQTLCAPTVQTQALTTVQSLAVQAVQVQTLAVPVVVQQFVRQRPVRIRTRTVTRTGFGLGLF